MAETMRTIGKRVLCAAEDVANGMVEVRGGSRLVITLKSPADYAVDLRSRNRLVQGIAIDPSVRAPLSTDRDLSSVTPRLALTHTR